MILSVMFCCLLDLSVLNAAAVSGPETAKFLRLALVLRDNQETEHTNNTK